MVHARPELPNSVVSAGVSHTPVACTPRAAGSRLGPNPRISSRASVILQLFWIGALITVILQSLVLPAGHGLGLFLPAGWDVRVYAEAMHTLRLGQDPYAVGIAAQKAFGRLSDHPPGTVPPMTYVYSPVTLPLLRAFSTVPERPLGILYWMTYVAAFLGTLWVAAKFLRDEEHRIFPLLFPAIVFFPCLLEHDVIYSGNAAYILYGAILAIAWVGWRHDRWVWFYLVVLAASCLKPPLLTFLVIPAFSAKRQWLWAGLTGVAGIALFALQARLWPTLFREYLQAVDMQFSYNLDFGVGPASLLARTLDDMGLRYSYATISYLIYAPAIFLLLLYLSRLYRAGRISFGTWIPVLLLGLVLLNPRVKEYDIHVVTVPIAIIGWRFVASITKTRRQAYLLSAIAFLWVNYAANLATGDWKMTSMLLMVSVLGVGVWELLKEAEATGQQATTAAA